MKSLIKRTCSAVTSRFTPSLGPSEARWWIRHGPIIRSFCAHKSKAIAAHASSLKVLFSAVCLCQRNFTNSYAASGHDIPRSWTLIHAPHPVLGFFDSRIERPSRPLIATSSFYLLPFAFQPNCHRTDIHVTTPTTLSISVTIIKLFRSLFDFVSTETTRNECFLNSDPQWYNNTVYETRCRSPVVPFQKREKNPIDLVAVFRKVSLAPIVSLVLNVPLVSIKRIEKIRGIKLQWKVMRTFLKFETFF